MQYFSKYKAYQNSIYLDYNGDKNCDAYVITPYKVMLKCKDEANFQYYLLSLIKIVKIIGCC